MPLVLSPKNFNLRDDLWGCQFSRMIVVESELDALALWSLCPEFPIVGLGTALNKPDAELFEALRLCRSILFIPDFDEAGKAAARWWRMTFPQVVIWPPGIGKDPGEMFEAGADVWAWLKAGLEM